MLPPVLSSELQQGAEDFLRTSFSATTPHFEGMLDRFFERDGSVFKGPYVSVDLPFHHSGHGPDYFPEVPLGFPPYAHQAKAFGRLSGPERKSTIVATGTGSGKTEAFLWPVLDYVREHMGEKGIKAILIYPMNALANDQASRIAKAAYDIDALSNLRAGLYVGDREENPTVNMGPGHVITDRNTQRLSPPDVLLTNYKMLDYLLTRPSDAELWKHNGPETLRYLVVDELHTFDGAQGTDLACLIRRLKDRLGTKENYLCCVGTSATLGGADDFGRLRSYAEDVFGEPFEEGSVVGEERTGRDTFLKETDDLPIPTSASAEDLSSRGHDSQEDYVRAQAKLWLGERVPDDLSEPEGRVRLGEALREHPFLPPLLEEAGEPRPVGELASALSGQIPSLAGLPEPRRRALLRSFLSLLSWARSEAEIEDKGGIGPFVHTRSQLWLRELKRMVASIEEEPTLRYWDDLPDAQERNPHLPLARCLECSAMGWVGMQRQRESRFREDGLKGIYRRYFGNEPSFSFAFPVGEGEEGGREDFPSEGRHRTLCGHDLHLSGPSAETCEACGRGDRLVPIFQPKNRKTTGDGHQEGSKDCPFCGTTDGLTIVGSQASSLSSVLISQVFASSYNEDKSLLTFSDSVQDASHRAGYFGAKTYRFNVRSAIQQALQKTGEPVPLDAFQETVAEHYIAEMSEEEFISTFIAPDMEWFSDFESMKETGEVPEEGDLTEDVTRRLKWEVWSAYGFRARTGRTLEKTGSSVAVPNTERLSNATEELLPLLRNEVGNLQGVTRKEVRRFIRGAAEHLKTKGAIYHPELRSYVKEGGNGFLLNRRHHLPGLGRLPAFVSNRGSKRFDPIVRTSGSTWLEKWAIKCFGGRDPMLEGSLAELYDQAFKVLIDAGLLEKTPTRKGEKAWGLVPQALEIRSDVAQLRCGRCGHNLSTWKGAEGDWSGASCLRRSCGGQYEPGQRRPQKQNYYRQLYSQSDVRRIVAKEHTGLLSRERRETLEKGFQEQDRPWAPNLLSCTPTLELGVDVGQLSSVVLCSVPPTPSNFAQRIGRGGRESGNAVDVTVANGRAHDLYFFEEPLEMVAGEIKPPGVFLRAVEVLFRQFVAHCFDRWVETGGAEVPQNLSRLLNGVGDEDVFPGPWLRFIDENREALLEDFAGLFDREEGIAEDLRELIEEEGGISVQVREELDRIRKRRKDLRRRRRRLRGEIQDLEEEPATEKRSDEIEKLREEKGAIQKIYRRIGEKNTYNFLTSAGLLPNYAFPESGVTLRSVLYRSSEDEQEVLSNEFVRPGPQALRELAPGATFYANERAVEVDQIDLSGEEAIEEWRFCDRCSNMVREAKEAASRSACPQCGSPTWSDQGQVQALVRHEEVRATTSDRESRVDDPSEGRGEQPFEISFQPQIEESNVERAYRIDSEDLPFGFEFIEEATFREVNFGNLEEQATLQAGGEEVNGQGFSTCRNCGRVATGGDPIDHTRSCPAKGTEGEEGSSGAAETVHLYREISSEAVRILLPETSFAGKPEKVQSFKAAFEMGLEEHFQGSVAHLNTKVHEGPGDEKTARRKYLLLYDTVPGGTGYLAELLRDETVLLQVLREARDALSECPCADEEGRDGCYRCLYAYRNQYNMPHTSRSVAQQLLSDILSHSDRIKEIDTVRQISVDGALESELEARFIVKLKAVDGIRLEKASVRGRQGYSLEAGDRSFQVEPQVRTGPKDGVSRPVSIDFVIRPEEESRLPIAVFLDGFQYHKNRIEKDLSQRRALRRSGKCHVWSLTWDDITGSSPAERDYLCSLRGTDGTFTQTLECMGETEFKACRDICREEGSFKWLLRLLKEPALMKRVALAQAFLLAKREDTETSDWLEAARLRLPSSASEALAEKGEESRVTGLKENPSDPVSLWSAFSEADIRALQESPEKALESVALGLHLNGDRGGNGETFETAWNGLLRTYNLLQLIPETYPSYSGSGSTAGVEYGHEGPTGRREESDPEEETVPGETTPEEGVSRPEGSDGEKPSDPSGEEAWETVLEHAFGDISSLLRQLRESGAPPPEVPPFALQREGEIVAEAELGWPGLDVAILLPGQSGRRDEFEQDGWETWALSEAKEDPVPLLDALG